MKIKNIMAIDPGASGGIAWVCDDQVWSEPMPEGMTEQADAIRSIIVQIPIKAAYIEQVGTYQPGNSGPAAATFARHVGNLEAILYMCGVSTVKVIPAKWMKSLGTMPKDKKARKNKIKEEMARRYPHLKVTLKTADALGLLTYALEKEK
jgi:hypothetical protein